MRWALEGHPTHYPEWAMALDMAHGDPLRAKEIYNSIDAQWTHYWATWRTEIRKAGIPDYIVGMYKKK